MLEKGKARQKLVSKMTFVSLDTLLETLQGKHLIYYDNSKSISLYNSLTLFCRLSNFPFAFPLT